jgi:hypothetical protein
LELSVDIYFVQGLLRVFATSLSRISLLMLAANNFADAAEDLAFRVLGNSGFAPEWVTLNKDIRNATARWRAALKAAWLRKLDTSRGSAKNSWEEERPKLEADLAEINRKVNQSELCVSSCMPYSIGICIKS